MTSDRELAEEIAAVTRTPERRERIRNARRYYEAWAQDLGLPVWPVTDSSLRLYMFDRTPLWAWSYARTVMQDLADAHEDDGLEPAHGPLTTDHLQRRRRDEGPRRVPDVPAFMLDDALNLDLEKLPRTRMKDRAALLTRSALLVATGADLPLCLRANQVSAMLLTRDAFQVNAENIEVSLPGTVVTLDSSSDPAGWDGLRQLLEDTPSGQRPFVPKGVSLDQARLVGFFWGRTGWARERQTAPLGSLSSSDRRWLQCSTDPDLARRWRDRAYLQIGITQALRHASLSALTVADVTTSREGHELLLRRSKTDQIGRGRVVRIVHDDRVLDGPDPDCPACVLDDHLLVVRASGRDESTPLFATWYAQQWRSMTRQNGRHRTRAMWVAAGGDLAAAPSTRGMRIGGATGMALDGAPLGDISELLDHRTPSITQGYIQGRVKDRQSFLDV